MCHVYNCQNIIKEKTCFKNPHNPFCIDLVITNRQKNFQNFMVIETGLSDFHKMSLTAMKSFYIKKKDLILLDIVVIAISIRKFLLMKLKIIF